MNLTQARAELARILKDTTLLPEQQARKLLTLARQWKRQASGLTHSLFDRRPAHRPDVPLQEVARTIVGLNELRRTARIEALKSLRMRHQKVGFDVGKPARAYPRWDEASAAQERR